MKKTMIAFVLLAVMALASCSTTVHHQKADTGWKGVDPIAKGEVQWEPITESGGRIVGTATISSFLGIFKNGDMEYAADFIGMYGLGTVADAKTAAILKATEKGKCDIIICPRFRWKIERSFLSEKVTATVWGFAGHIKGVRKVKKEKNIVYKESRGDSNKVKLDMNLKIDSSKIR